MTAQWVLSWWNLIFIVPFGLALLYLGLYTLTGWTFGEGDAHFGADAHADIDGDADADFHADADLHADADIDGDADVHADAEVHADGHAEAVAHDHGHESDEGSIPTFLAMLTWVGVGRAPLGLVLMILLMTWGFIGFASNNMVRPAVPMDWMVALVSIPLAAVASLFITSVTARLVARYLPTSETNAHPRRELVGLVGESLYPITSQFGMAVVRDPTAGLIQVACRVQPDQTEIAKGEKVLLVRYDESDRAFDVIPYELGRTGLQLRSQ